MRSLSRLKQRFAVAKVAAQASGTSSHELHNLDTRSTTHSTHLCSGIVVIFFFDLAIDALRTRYFRRDMWCILHVVRSARERRSIFFCDRGSHCSQADTDMMLLSGKVNGHLYHEDMRCTLCGCCLMIVLDRINTVRCQLIYLKHRLHLYVFSLLALRLRLFRIYLCTGLHYPLFQSKSRGPESE